jgi:transposase
VVIDAVINKYSFHLPLYRQSVILERESGLHLSRATLNGWMMRVGEMLTPIVTAMGQELLAGNYIQADETPVAVQMHDGRGKNHQAYLWQYGRPGGSTIFEFRLGRDREGPKKFLGNFEGILQSDGYAAYCHLQFIRSAVHLEADFAFTSFSNPPFLQFIRSANALLPLR